MPRAIVRVTGEESASYLQGQVSQDIDAIPPGGNAWSLVLDPTGKLVAWFRIHRTGDAGLVFDAEPGVVDALVGRLDRFKLRTAVDFEIEREWVMESVRGAGVEPGSNAELVGGFDWPGFSGFDVLREGRPEGVIGPEFERARIRAGVPRMGVDIGDDTIPAEGGAPFMAMSVSLTKGCYTGQELVARIDSRGGNVPRPLRVIEGQGGLEVGAGVVYDGVGIGTLTSAVDNVGLGRILRKAGPGAAVTVGGVEAAVLAAGPP